MEETTREAVERLLRLCEEARRRVEEEPHEDFTVGLDVLQEECHRLSLLLHARLSRRIPFMSPFAINQKRYIEYPTLFDYSTTLGVYARQSGDDRWFWVTDPFVPDDSGNCFYIRMEFPDGGGRWWPEEPITREWAKSRLVTLLKSWVRFLNEELEKLGTASPTLEAPLEGILTGEQPRRKTGRPKTKQLDQRQLKSILARLDKGETLKQVHKDYEKNIPNYHTFRRRVRPHLQNPYGKSKERR